MIEFLLAYFIEHDVFCSIFNSFFFTTTESSEICKFTSSDNGFFNFVFFLFTLALA